MTVSVAHPANVGRVQNRHCHWIYVDDDQDCYWKIASKVSTGCKPLICPGMLQVRAAKVRTDFVTWVDRCLESASPEQWLTTPLYKNPHDNPLFLHFCWLREIEHQLATGIDDILIVSASSGFAAVVEALCMKYRVGYACYGKARLRLTRVEHVILAFGACLANICSLLWRMLLARFILGSGYRAQLAGADIIVDTYLLEQDLKDSGQFSDRYFPELVEFYSQRGLKSASYPLLYQIPITRVSAVFARMKRSKILFAPYELFTTPADLLRAVYQSLVHTTVRVPLQALPPPSIDLRKIVEWHQPVSAMRAFIALVMSRIPGRLAACGIQSKWLIDWYENQPIDKANQIGFTRTGCRVIAVRQYPPAPNYPSLYTTTGEVMAGVAPDENWVCGKNQISTMAIYDSVGKYRVVPALRYAHLYNTATLPGEGDHLLVLLPQSRAEARLILHCLASSLSELSRLFAGLVMKPHHTTPASTIRTGICQHFPQFFDKVIEWDESSLDSLLPGARIVITSHSSAALEAICMGKPVILVGRLAGLSVNPLEDIDRRLWHVVYDASGLVEKTKQWSPTHPLPFEERTALGRQIRDAYFEPVTNETLARFIPDDAGYR